MYEPIKFGELLRRNAELAPHAGPTLNLAVLANITITAIKEVLEFSLRSRNIGALVTIGDYDNVAQDSGRYRDCDGVVIFYELAGIIDNLPFQLHSIDESGIDRLIDKAKRELTFTFSALADSKLVILNLLTAIPFTLGSQRDTALDRICSEVNEFIREHAPKSFRLVDLQKIFARCSAHACIDFRFFVSSRALYQFAFLRAYCEFIYPLIGMRYGQYKKVLALDCDNTLWRGVLGEDGPDGIEMFSEIQSMVVQLAQTGVLICLCSKNNPEDIEKVLQDPRMVLRDEHLVVKAVNWNDKAGNLLQIAETLRLGIESFVLVDDSDFELHLIREKLPAVTTFKVPASYSEYLWLFQNVGSLFGGEEITKEDRAKTVHYRTEYARREEQARFGTVEDYLASLELSITVAVNTPELVPRLAQLSQKTNQFNLTTQRMSQAEMAAAMAGGDCVVLGVDVSDKYGSYGTTGLLVARQDGAEAWIDNFLLSCRIIGRGIEFKIFDTLVALLRRRGVCKIYGTYRATEKNVQVRDLYERLGFDVIEDESTARRFELTTDRYEDSRIDYIRIANT